VQELKENLGKKTKYTKYLHYEARLRTILGQASRGEISVKEKHKGGSHKAAYFFSQDEEGRPQKRGAPVAHVRPHGSRVYVNPKAVRDLFDSSLDVLDRVSQNEKTPPRPPEAGLPKALGGGKKG
jgi:hypothetical protein